MSTLIRHCSIILKRVAATAFLLALAATTASAQPRIAANPSALSFPPMPYHSSVGWLGVNFRNPDGVDIPILSLTIEGPDADRFILGEGQSMSVLGQHSWHAVLVKPTTDRLGGAQAELVLRYSGGAGEIRVPLSSLTMPPRSDITLRLNAGGSAGESPFWQPDYGYFLDTGILNLGSGFVFPDVDTGLDEDMMYRSERHGADGFGYHVALDPGIYDVRLYFAELWWDVTEGVGGYHRHRRLFSVFMENELVIENYDIWSNGAGNPRHRQERFLAYVEDGYLDLSFVAQIGYAQVNGIEILGLEQVPEGDAGFFVPWSSGLEFVEPVAVGQSVTGSLSLYNGGPMPMWISGATVETPVYASDGNGAMMFSVDLPPGTQIDGYERLEVPVTFSPRCSGRFNAYVSIHASGVRNVETRVWLTGTSYAPETLTPVPSASSLNFTVGWPADVQEQGITIRNNGTSGIYLSRSRLIGDESDRFSITTELTNQYLAPGESIVVWLRYLPEGQAGDHHAQFVLEHTGAGGPIVVDLHATEYEPDLFAAVKARPVVLNFDPVPLGADTGGALQLMNWTFDPWTPAFREAGNPADYDLFEAQLRDGVSTLAPGASAIMDIVFTADRPGLHSIELRAAPSPGTSPVLLVARTEGTEPPLRINCGGPALVDSQGRQWLADVCFSGRVTNPPYTSTRAIAGTVDDALYQTERYSDGLLYAVPVPEGSYDVVLHFAELWWGVESRVGQDNRGRRVFNVSVEGVWLPALDLVAEAGPGAALSKTFEAVYVADGVLEIECVALADNAKLSGIEILPRADPGLTEPLRINVGGPQVMAGGFIWQADPLSNSPENFAWSNPLLTEFAFTDKDALFVDTRSTPIGGSFTYELPVPSVGSYEVTLYFAENHYNVPGYGETFSAVNRRHAFDLAIEGDVTPVDIDPAWDAARAMSVVRTVRVEDGMLTITASSASPLTRPTLAAMEVRNAGGGL